MLQAWQGLLPGCYCASGRVTYYFSDVTGVLYSVTGGLDKGPSATVHLLSIQTEIELLLISIIATTGAITKNSNRGRKFNDESHWSIK